jgi:hypothetical protein
MPYRILRDASVGSIEAQLPRELAVFVLFRVSDRPIREATVSAALKRLVPDEPFVAIGGTFSLAALALLESRDALIVPLRGATWTEQGFDLIRGLIATNVKREEDIR